MSSIKLLHDNFADPETYSAFTYSSQKTAAPASNVLNFIRRGKPWRSDGQWEITSANKGIVLQEVAAANQTVNIAEGTYTSDSAFLTALKAALDGAAGTAVYTVTRDTTTNKIKITSNGGGGAIFRLMCTDAAFTSASILGFSTASDLTGSLTYTADTLKIHTSEFLKFDMGTSVNPKAFVIFGERNQPIKLSETAVIKIQGSSTDAWTSPAYSLTLDYHARSIGTYSDTGLHTAGLRWWRVYIEDPSNVNGYVEISAIYLGDAFVPANAAVQFPLDIAEIDPSDVTPARGGTAFVDELESSNELRLEWDFISVSEADELRDFIREVGRKKPFFVMLDPEGVFSETSGNNNFMVRFKDAPSLRLKSPGIFKSDWTLREEI
jgi:hypothetical protein